MRKEKSENFRQKHNLKSTGERRKKNEKNLADEEICDVSGGKEK